MSDRKSLNTARAAAALTKKRRWVPLEGMKGASIPSSPTASWGPSTSGSERHHDLEWLIVGGGIHGTYLSHFLTASAGVPREALRVVDPYDRPLASWQRNALNVGMEYLRSASVHHLDLASLSMKRFGVSGECSGCGEDRPPLIAPYGRPLLSLFNEHAQATIARMGLEQLRIEGRVCGLRAIEGGYEVDYRTGERVETIRSRNVLLAIGMDDATCWPDWAVGLRSAGVRIHHVLDRGFDRRSLGSWRRALVYGGGLSGAQVSAVLAARFPGSVTLVSGHAMEVHLFDSEPSWQGGNFMGAFASESDPVRRREIILRERHRGSLTPEAHGELQRLEGSRALRVVTVDPEGLRAEAVGSDLRLRTAHEDLEGDLLILATGYDTARPGGAWLDEAIADMQLPCAPCGYPVVTPGLEWRTGLFVSGPLAELELGPVSRNISGAHRAAARLEYYRLGSPKGRG